MAGTGLLRQRLQRLLQVSVTAVVKQKDVIQAVTGTGLLRQRLQGLLQVSATAAIKIKRCDSGRDLGCDTNRISPSETTGNSSSKCHCCN